MNKFILLIALFASLSHAKDINPLCDSSGVSENLKRPFTKLVNKSVIHLSELGMSLKKESYFVARSEAIDSVINFARSSMCATNTMDFTDAYLMKMQSACLDQCRQGSCIDSGKSGDCSKFSSDQLSPYLMCISTCDSVMAQYEVFANAKKSNGGPEKCTKKTAIDNTERSVQKIVDKLNEKERTPAATKHK